jgi:alpha-beta hydrolase superfamily lysophospholipase
MRWYEDWLGATDGRRLYWQAWLPDGPASAVAVVVHGVAEHGGRYDFVAERLAAAGVAVSISYALRHPDSIAGLVLSGPAVATQAVSPAMLAISRVMSALLPRLPVFELDERLISRDDRVVQAYREDPLVHPGKLPARTLWQILRSMQTLPHQVGDLRMPILLLHGGEDQLCPPSGSQVIYEHAGSPDRTIKVYPGLYHEVFNEPEREEVIGDVIKWLAKRDGRAESAGERARGDGMLAERESA